MSDKARPSLRAAQGFPPLIDATSRVLILGTMPGEESLRRQEYYGHPRNQFWRILADLFYAPLAETYPERVALLRQRRLAVWDVLLMPSTSPAATLPLSAKIERWRQISAWLEGK